MEGKKLALFLLLVVVFLELPPLLNAEAKSLWWHHKPRCSKTLPPGRWVNRWQGCFYFRCPLGKSIYVWRSVHRNCQKDRVHRFRCRRAPFHCRKNRCYNTEYVNHFDGKVDFTCPSGVIAGVKSDYSRPHGDRRFSFRCCMDCSYRATKCHWTSWKNAWDGKLKFRVRRRKYHLVGVRSVHSNYHEDRRYQFRVCKFRKLRRRHHWRNETELSSEQGLKRYRMPSKLLVRENA